MPILASNFAANALQGTVTVTGGLANIVLPLSAFAFEGTKTFVVKLRKEGYTGIVIGTSNTITIPDTTGIVSLTANATTTAEGNIILYTLTTSNVVNGTNVYYSTNSIVTANVNSNDFVGGNTGIITINNNIGTLSLVTNADLSLFDETNETFTLQIRTNNTSGNVVITSSNVTVLDTSNQYNVLSFVENAIQVTEGGTLTLTANVINIAAGTLLYYDTTGNVTTSNFTGGNTGSFRMNSLSNTISLVTTSTVPYGTQADFRVRIRRDSVTGTVLATSNLLYINDTALTQMTATGGNVALIGNFKYHTYNTSGTFSVTSAGTTGNIEYLVVAGGGAGSVGKASPPYGGGSGGGAGGYRTNVPGEISGGGSPAESALIITAGTYTVTVGAGGSAPPTTTVVPGNNSNIYGTGVSIISLGGGGGASFGVPGNGASGGSGGGYVAGPGGAPAGGAGTPGQGYPGLSNQAGGGFLASVGGGGGGAGGPAVYGALYPNGGNPYAIASQGGLAKSSTAWQYQAPSPVGGQYGFGGSGGAGPAGFPGANANLPAGPQRGTSGGGSQGGPAPGYPGTSNTGDGGGGGGYTGAEAGPYQGGNGGSGIVIIRYPFTGQYFTTLTTSTPNVLNGANVTFNLSVLNANGTTLYYSTDGNVTSSNFIGGNSGSFVANTTGATITLQSNTNLPLGTTRNFTLLVRQDSVTGPVSITGGNVVVSGYTANINATGGNQIVDASGYRHHIFLSSNTFNVSGVSAAGNIEILAVAAGGGAGPSNGNNTGGGGAGGFLLSNLSIGLNAYSVVVGAAGSPAPNGSTGLPGSPSSVGSSFVAIGGGGGAYGGGSSIPSLIADFGGGSGGGQGGFGGPGGTGTPGQGFPGGTSSGPGGAFYPNASGGGGAGAAAAGSTNGDIAGGIGRSIDWAIPASYGTAGPAPGRWFAGGGGGYGGGGGAGGGGGPNTAGTVNTGGGGGGRTGTPAAAGAPGGSGIVIIRYPYV